MKNSYPTLEKLKMDLLCWGSGDLGQTGHGRRGDVGPDEAQLREFTGAGFGRVKLMACGSSHSIVVTVDNGIFAWGNGTNGQLGDGERTVKHQPVQIHLPQLLNVKGSATDDDIISVAGVACGSRHSFIWTETGRAFSFGNNYYAQLGYDFQRADFKEHQLAPRLFQNLPSSLKISQVACGERHTLFALEDGRVAACGQNDYGQIGSGSNENVIIPRFVECVDHVSKVTCGANHSLALTGDARLLQWGCGRACGNTKTNVLYPEEVTLPASPVKDLAAGCWHSLLLTDGGNVFSWGMGQEGQLGLGEEWIHISTPRLLSFSQLAEVKQIQAGDSYSAAVAAGGELLLWGHIPCVSQVNDHPALRRIWIPQRVPLSGRTVRDVACGTWHMMALTTRSRERKRDCAHPETEAPFRDLVSNPVPTEHREKENTVKAGRLPGPERPVVSEEQETDEERDGSEEDEGHEERVKDTSDGTLHDAAFAAARSAIGMDGTGNRHSSITSDRGVEREGGETSRLSVRRMDGCRGRGSGEVVFTTLQLLPRSDGEQVRQSASTLPRLQTGHPAHSRLLTEMRKDRANGLSELVQKSGSDRVPQSPKLGPKPRPPGRYAGPGARNVASCHRSSMRIHTGFKSPVYSSSPHLHPEQQFQMSSSLFPQVEASPSPTLPSSESFRHCPPRR